MQLSAPATAPESMLPPLGTAATAVAAPASPAAAFAELFPNLAPTPAAPGTSSARHGGADLSAWGGTGAGAASPRPATGRPPGETPAAEGEPVVLVEGAESRPAVGASEPPLPAESISWVAALCGGGLVPLAGPVAASAPCGEGSLAADEPGAEGGRSGRSAGDGGASTLAMAEPSRSGGGRSWCGSVVTTLPAAAEKSAIGDLPEGLPPERVDRQGPRAISVEGATAAVGTRSEMNGPRGGEDGSPSESVSIRRPAVENTAVGGTEVERSLAGSAGSRPLATGSVVQAKADGRPAADAAARSSDLPAPAAPRQGPRVETRSAVAGSVRAPELQLDQRAAPPPRAAPGEIMAGPAQLPRSMPAARAAAFPEVQAAGEAVRTSADSWPEVVRVQSSGTAAVEPAEGGAGTLLSADEWPALETMRVGSAAAEPAAPGSRLHRARQAPGSEKIAGRGPGLEEVRIRGDNTSVKDFQFTRREEVNQGPAELGTGDAKPWEPMPLPPLISRLAPPSVARSDGDLALSGPGATAPARSEADGYTAEPALAARRAVEAVLDIVHTLAHSERRAVKLEFPMGDAELSVHLQWRRDEVHTIFRTDSAELRSALEQECRLLGFASPDRAVRLAPPIISDRAEDGGGFNAANGGNSSDGGAWQRQAAAGWAEFPPRRAAPPRPSVPPTAEPTHVFPALRPTALHLQTVA